MDYKSIFHQLNKNQPLSSDKFLITLTYFASKYLVSSHTIKGGLTASRTRLVTMFFNSAILLCVSFILWSDALKEWEHLCSSMNLVSWEKAVSAFSDWVRFSCLLININSKESCFHFWIIWLSWEELVWGKKNNSSNLLGSWLRSPVIWQI